VWLHLSCLHVEINILHIGNGVKYIDITCKGWGKIAREMFNSLTLGCKQIMWIETFKKNLFAIPIIDYNDYQE
jgi:hypothetical protein